MDEPKHKRTDRYDVTGNVEAEYVDEAHLVLVNKQRITDLQTLQILEEEALAKAYESLLSEVRVDTPMTTDLILHIHQRIFGELYEWSGRWRTVWISKPGTTWPPPDFLDQSMRQFEANVLRKYPANTLQGDETFCRAAGEIHGEFLVVHPFREGNARTIKLLTDLLAAQTGRPLLRYDTSDAGQRQYIDAAKAAFKRNYAPLVTIIKAALAEGRASL